MGGFSEHLVHHFVQFGERLLKQHKNGKQKQTNVWEIQIERMWITKRRTYYQSTQEGKKKKQAHLASRHYETNAVLPFWLSFGGISIPKVSIDHQGFAGTITHMDGDDTEEKTERNHVHNNKYKHINKHEACVVWTEAAGMRTELTFT